MSDNIFNQNSDQTTDQNNPSTQQVQQPAFDTLLASIKNEKGESKYKDVPTALDALKHSQDYIQQLKEERDRLAAERAELASQNDKLKTLEDTVFKLTSQQQQPNTTPVISEEVVANLVQETLTKREQAQVQQANVSKVVNQMQASFGENAEKAFYEKANEIGLSPQQINALAAQSPQAVLRLFGLENSQTQQRFPSAPQSSVNTSGFTPKQQSFIGRNLNQALIGATTQDLMTERENSKRLVEELQANGMSTNDLTDPKTYFKYFK